MIDALRTPDERFANLPDFPWAPHYIDDLPGYEGLRCAVIDEGPKSGAPTFLCLHGEPTWSFLYRRMIPAFLASGARVVAPDLFGFGRSDKPVDDAVYGFHFHRRMLLALVERLDLQDITLVVQDWGGLIGLTLPVDEGFRGRLSRLIAMNTTLATGVPPSPGFLAWRAYAKANPDLAVGDLIGRGTPHLSEAERAAYDAPFPDIRYKAGVRAFPERVMTDPGMEGIEESLAAQAYRDMVVRASLEDLVLTKTFTGADAYYLRESIVAAGLDPDALVGKDKMDWANSQGQLKAWKNIWSAGQGVNAIHATAPTARIVDRLVDEYAAALRQPAFT